MPFIYIVIENSDDEPSGGGLIPRTFHTFEEARTHAIAKYTEELNRQREECGDYEIASEVDVPESETGLTTLYIEKGIHIYIHKLHY